MTSCQDGWVSWSDSCFLLVMALETHNDASAHCATLDAELATITSVEENTAVANYLLAEKFVHQVHIGGNDNALEGSWVWETGEPFFFDSWEVTMGQPTGTADENCLAMKSTGGWHDIACSSSNAFVCEIGPPPDYYDYGVVYIGIP